jgi:osmotically-inducible protein OsmY
VARDVALRVPGVLDVADDLEVIVPQPCGDAAIAAAVRHALQWNVHVPDQRIQSTVSDGRVTLTGTVDLLRERDDAARIATLAGELDSWAEKDAVLARVSHTRGVRAIDDRLRVAQR